MKQTDIILPPMPVVACPQCRLRMRLYGIEPHMRLAHTELHTYVCAPCDMAETLIVPLARQLGASVASPPA